MYPVLARLIRSGGNNASLGGIAFTTDYNGLAFQPGPALFLDSGEKSVHVNVKNASHFKTKKSADLRSAKYSQFIINNNPLFIFLGGN
jgi:hypothetical protein